MRNIVIVAFIIFSVIMLLYDCEPLVTRFEETEDVTLYKSHAQQDAPSAVDKIRVMTWNIRFGAGRIPWFGDSCGDRVLLSQEEVEINLKGIAEAINRIKPDILILNEIDIQSKRTAYIDQVQWLLDHTYFNFGVYASNWKAQFIPSDGLGRMDAGNAIFSRWSPGEAIRIQLSLRGDQDALTRYFYLRLNILKTKINLPGLDNFYIVATHLSAFSTDDTKQKQVNELMRELSKLNDNNSYFIMGGDLNLLPPGAQKTDYCFEDICQGESYHGPHDDPLHKEGSNYTPEKIWLQPLYDNYQPAIPLQEYLANESRYFTHSTSADHFWDRKLDYLFTNYQWISGSDSTHQNIRGFSDHVAVSADWDLP